MLTRSLALHCRIKLLVVTGHDQLFSVLNGNPAGGLYTLSALVDDAEVEQTVRQFVFDEETERLVGCGRQRRAYNVR